MEDLTQSHDAPAWKKLGIELKTVEAVIDGAVECADLWLVEDPRKRSEANEQVQYWVEANELDRVRLFALGCAGFTGFPPLISDWRSLAMGFPAIAIEYFFGTWRRDFKRFGYDQYDEARARRELPWIDVYRSGIFLAAAFSDWNAFDCLLTWADVDLPFDDGTDDRTPEDCAFHIWLAMAISGRVQATFELKKKIQDSSRRRPRMLLSIAESIFAKDRETATQEMTKYLRYYRKNEFRPNRVDFAVALDAGLLWHVARRQGLNQLDLPDDIYPLIARP